MPRASLDFSFTAVANISFSVSLDVTAVQPVNATQSPTSTANIDLGFIFGTNTMTAINIIAAAIRYGVNGYFKEIYTPEGDAKSFAR